ncbi:hypothetical protein [Roseivirga misakiensis]|nr:hypothetical protein [Roseivirga misakiensis]
MAQEFLKASNFKQSEFHFILTFYESRKRLKLIYGDSVLFRKNVYLDENSLFHNGGFYSMYPTVIKYGPSGFKLKNMDPNSYDIWRSLELGSYDF